MIEYRNRVELVGEVASLELPRTSRRRQNAYRVVGVLVAEDTIRGIPVVFFGDDRPDIAGLNLGDVVSVVGLVRMRFGRDRSWGAVSIDGESCEVPSESDGAVDEGAESAEGMNDGERAS